MDLAEYLKEKRVVVVGPVQDEQYEAINRADVVVRLHNYWLTQGGRCDLLVTNCGPESDPRHYFDTPPKGCRAVIAQAGSSLIHEGLKLSEILHCNFHTYGISTDGADAWYVQLCNLLNPAPPLTGFVALWNLMRFECKEIRLVGMDLYYHTPAHEWARDPHDPFKHCLLLKKIVEIDPRVKICRGLENALSRC